MSLEQPFWDMLQDIAASRGQSLASLVQKIDRKRDGGLSSALRLFVLAELKKETAVVKTDIKPLDHWPFPDYKSFWDHRLFWVSILVPRINEPCV